ncbi:MULTISPECIES: DegT/DnrJ/EryC1/StrS family aminotransferase [Virgibacillus]|uniref:DegT/DnrJ/EryC1/StrS family aminotransferase n=1 Tax=Virgibacillus TaxID=84406 RepID=UPI0003882196|nr:MULTISPECIES: DegT/DnrJ/EryC1/StrS family aminotransferase [Virgibacillus]EQB36707.1 hypothetical protein M948_16880 [Virgibacillus sp. CM-4]MYL42534.1 aminotransferase class V-fold PLP-dependent enzyme [Virgibacillus massiliensis]
MIPISNPRGQLEQIQTEIEQTIRTVIESGSYVMGPHVERLEQEFAKKIGVTEAIAVANGTDALVLTLQSYGIGSGDEVITTPFSFFATAESISRVGATPVFVDVDPKTYTINPQKIEDKLTPATKAIMPVHLFGQPAAMDTINQIANYYGLIVVEDACQAFGATRGGQMVGSLGDAACFSFFPTKNLSTIGDGGIITTSDNKIAKRIRSLRVHGSSQKYFHDEIGFNSRLDEIHAAVILVCLKYINGWNNHRIELAKKYYQTLAPLTCMKLPYADKKGEHTYHLFCIASYQRDKLKGFLDKQGIQTGVYYPCCIHLQRAYREHGYQDGDYPIAEALANTLLAIPLFPSMTELEQDSVVHALEEFEVAQSW